MARIGAAPRPPGFRVECGRRENPAAAATAYYDRRASSRNSIQRRQRLNGHWCAPRPASTGDHSARTHVGLPTVRLVSPHFAHESPRRTISRTRKCFARAPDFSPGQLTRCVGPGRRLSRNVVAAHAARDSSCRALPNLARGIAVAERVLHHDIPSRRNVGR
jgi:hypothetical protein